MPICHMKQNTSKVVFTSHILSLILLMCLITQGVHANAECPGTIMSDYGISLLEQAAPGKVIYYGKDSLQYGELYIPEGTGPFPTIVMIHGGCWLAEFDMNHMRALANAFRDEGYAVWNIEYRRVGHPGGGWPGTFLDVGAATDHLRELVREHPLDMKQVTAVGHSAGGHLALWLGMRHKLGRKSEIYSRDPLTLKSVLALEPGTVLRDLHHNQICGHVIDGLMGGSPKKFPTRYRDGSPAEQIPIGIPHTILVGWLSGFGMMGSSYFFTAKAAGDKQVKIVEAPESGHFEMINPATSTWPIVLNALEELNK